MAGIEKRSKDDHTQALANNSPGGKLWLAKNINGSVLNLFLKGLACEGLNAETFLKTLLDEFIPDTTVKFIGEWESAVGIPDDCFSGTGTIEDRRRAVLAKLAASGVQTIEDFENLAQFFGVTVDVRSGLDLITFPLEFPVIFVGTEQEARFTIVVTFDVIDPQGFPYTFPILFGSLLLGLLRCLFLKLKPANADILFIEISP